HRFSRPRLVPSLSLPEGEGRGEGGTLCQWNCSLPCLSRFGGEGRLLAGGLGATARGDFAASALHPCGHQAEPVITLARICTTVGSLTFTESRRLRAKRSGVGKPMVMVLTRADGSSTSPKGFCCSRPRLRAAA